MISVTVIGRLGADPDCKELGEKTVCNLRIASKEASGTEWVSAVAFGKDAEFAKNYLTKGSSVAITGRLQTRKWTDKEGRDRYTTEVVVNRLEGIGGKGGAEVGEEKPF